MLLRRCVTRCASLLVPQVSSLLTHRRLITLCMGPSSDVVTLTGDETSDHIYNMVRRGRYVVAGDTIEAAHSAMQGIDELSRREHPVATMDDVIFLATLQKELFSRVLLRRAFWEYDDFTDPRSNQSFGIQNIYFDNYQWCNYLWPQFQSFVERWFPQSEHTFLSYREYLNCMLYFAAQVKGVEMKPLLPAGHKLKPQFRVPFPARAAREPLCLYDVWLRYFRAPLMLNRALVVHGGCGVLGLMTRLRGVPMVRVVDPSPLAIEGARDDANRLGHHYKNMSFMTAEMFPPQPAEGEKTHGATHKDYNLIVFNADLPLLRGLQDGDDSYHFAPGLQGYTKSLERFFEEAGKYLAGYGVVALLTTNVYTLAYPDRPHPVELEIRANRRWVLLDYYDRPMKGHQHAIAIDQWSYADAVGMGSHLTALSRFRGKLRSELWILHRVESIEEFAWLHGTPGAQPPTPVLKYWNRRKMRGHRLAMMRQQVRLRGEDWGDFKARMLKALQEHAGDFDERTGETDEAGLEPEDDEAVAIRMAMDPTYPAVLAKRAKARRQQLDTSEQAFHHAVASQFTAGRSPREDFDMWAHKVKAAGSIPPDNVVGEAPFICSPPLPELEAPVPIVEPTAPPHRGMTGNARPEKSL